MAEKKNNHKGSLIRRFSRRLVMLVNLAVAAVFLLACLQPWLSPETFWFIGYLGIAFPYLLLVLLGFLLFWLFTRHKWYALVPLVTIAIGYRQIGALFSLRYHPFSIEKKDGDLRVMTWNIMGFSGFEPGVKNRERNADRIFTLMDEYNPDVICLQEYGQFEDGRLGRSYLELMRKKGYVHEVLSRDYSRVTYSYSSGLAIFSRYPIVATKRLPFTSSAESMLYADIMVGSDTVRVFTTHLQSYRFSEEERAQIEKVKEKERPAFNPVASVLRKMKRAFRNRGAQVDQAVPLVDESPYPQIVCLDMNDVPGSYAYWKLRGDRKDVFLEKGFGIGRTYIAFAPTLRIDHIFCHPSFSVAQMAVVQRRYSDHLPLVADLRLQK
ncbi:MAG TPA: endonuclease/exonuclease/phosphatase family protein [Phnomibacter sp.]|nr:endonuclease/exonuclease/phosphatase family protein [Phnomibacter sp.]